MSWIKDPLVSFLAVGCALFFVTDWFGQADIPYEIDVREQDIARLQDQWQMQMRRPPTEQELTGLLEAFVKEEIYYRQAQRLGLDANDTIVRRRMVQKLTFLTEDIATAEELNTSELEAFYNDRLEQYRVPERMSFRHKYFSSDRREDAKGDAQAALGNPSEVGDPFMLQREYAQRSEREIGDLFGRDFASALQQLEPDDAWQGPIKSAYGWHTVQLTNKQSSQIQPFAEVRERVAVDAQQAARKEANDAYYQELRGQYTVNLPNAGS